MFISHALDANPTLAERNWGLVLVGRIRLISSLSSLHDSLSVSLGFNLGFNFGDSLGDSLFGSNLSSLNGILGILGISLGISLDGSLCVSLGVGDSLGISLRRSFSRNLRKIFSLRSVVRAVAWFAVLSLRARQTDVAYLDFKALFTFCANGACGTPRTFGTVFAW